MLMAAALLLPAMASAADVPSGGTISVSMQEDASGQAGAADARDSTACGTTPAQRPAARRKAPVSLDEYLARRQGGRS